MDRHRLPLPEVALSSFAFQHPRSNRKAHQQARDENLLSDRAPAACNSDLLSPETGSWRRGCSCEGGSSGGSRCCNVIRSVRFAALQLHHDMHSWLVLWPMALHRLPHNWHCCCCCRPHSFAARSQRVPALLAAPQAGSRGLAPAAAAAAPACSCSRSRSPLPRPCRRPRPVSRASALAVQAAAGAPAAILPSWLSPSAEKYRFLSSNHAMVRQPKLGHFDCFYVDALQPLFSDQPVPVSALHISISCVMMRQQWQTRWCSLLCVAGRGMLGSCCRGIAVTVPNATLSSSLLCHTPTRDRPRAC